MESLIDKLCLQRLCLPSNTNINCLRSCKIKSNIIECGNSHHIACIYEDNGEILKGTSFGINMYNNFRFDRTTHAEINMINKLPILPKNRKHLKKINILVIRTSLTGKIGMSKPCIKCIIDMTKLPPQKGYIIKEITYTDFAGNLITISLKKIIEDKNYHISRYYKLHNFRKI